MPITQPLRPIRVHLIPVINGVQQATVVQSVPDSKGRIAVTMHWSSYGPLPPMWIPIVASATDATSSLRIGDEVLVQFFEGEPSQPIIIGVTTRAGGAR